MGWALAAVTGLLLGGGVGVYTGQAAAAEVRAEMHVEVAKLEAMLKEADNEVNANQLRIVEGLTELKVEIRYIREKLDER